MTVCSFDYLMNFAFQIQNVKLVKGTREIWRKKTVSESHMESVETSANIIYMF